MPTTIHLRGSLLASVDRRARALGISRNRFIVQALKRAVEEETAWSQEFLEGLRLAAEDTESHSTVDAMLEAIASRRSHKAPPEL